MEKKNSKKAKAELEEQHQNDALLECHDLTEAETAELKKLLEEGFSAWTRRDLFYFVKAVEKYGKNVTEDYVTELDNKFLLADIKAYAAAFWKHGGEYLKDWEVLMKRFERSDSNKTKRDQIMRLVRWKTMCYKEPWTQVEFCYYTGGKGKTYTAEEDRFLLCATANYGYGEWENIKREINTSWQFRFDWFFKTRTVSELSRRLEILLRTIEKEQEQGGLVDKNEEKKRPRIRVRDREQERKRKREARERVREQAKANRPPGEEEKPKGRKRGPKPRGRPPAVPVIPSESPPPRKRRRKKNQTEPSENANGNDVDENENDNDNENENDNGAATPFEDEEIGEDENNDDGPFEEEGEEGEDDEEEGEEEEGEEEDDDEEMGSEPQPQLKLPVFSVKATFGATNNNANANANSNDEAL